MTSFIISAVLITLLVLVILVRPLLSTRNAAENARREQNIHFARERLQELKTQLDSGNISPTDYAALQTEIENTLATDLDLSSQTDITAETAKPTSGRVMIISLCVLLPLIAVGIYAFIGTPTSFNIVESSPDQSPQEIDQMVASIEQRLSDNPDDIEGWTILSRTYLALGRYQKARNGFLKLIELEGESANLYASLADASALISGGDLSGEPSSYVKRALALDPQHPQALWLAGLAAAQRNDPVQARLHWNQLMPLLQDNPQQQQELKEIIRQTFDEPTAKTDSPIGLSIKVVLAEGVIDQVEQSDLVFVFARAANGPPAPLAVKRLTVADLPADIVLSDADAMMEQLKLSLFADVIVSARIARSGNPVAQPGDIQSTKVNSKSDNGEQIILTISETIE